MLLTTCVTFLHDLSTEYNLALLIPEQRKLGLAAGEQREWVRESRQDLLFGVVLPCEQ